MASIGYLTTFSDFIDKYIIEIPRIQRDYTYGSKTEKTNKVLGKLLKDIHDSLTNQNELILDFVYGCDNEAFQPLDGQQRLTTLYLLYFFAACKAGVSINKSFKYATRDDSTIFCGELLGFKYEKEAGSLVGQIKDSAFYRPSFNDDPSIRSMLVVLERIETAFSDMVPEEQPSKLWDAINNDCPVKFYCLDFGKFTLSDDLYIKMNSRGKQLTEYEIFKSQFEKYIEVTLGDKDLKYETARLFDNDFTDLVWDSQGRDKTRIDGAFVNLFKNLFAIINYKYKDGCVKFDWKKPLYDNMSLLELDKTDVRFVMDFMGDFRYIQQNLPSFIEDNFYYSDLLVLDDKSGKIRFFKSKLDVFAEACESVMKNPQLVSLYAVDKAIQKQKEGVDWHMNFRHVRNLIEFSDDELGHAERLPGMLSEIELIMDGKLTTILAKESKFNTIQFEEELEKEQNQIQWKELLSFENHDVLRGSLSQFAYPDQFELANPPRFALLCERLSKFTFIFDNNARENDRKIRAALLSIGDIGQQHNQKSQNRMVGCQFGSWRLMFTKSSFYKKTKIIDVLDQVDVNKPFVINQVAKDDWRYYVSAEKYYDYTYVSYGDAKYGYYFTKENTRPLEMWLLQSTSCNDDNVMWKLLNLLLFNNLPSGLDVHFYKYQEDHKIKLNNEVAIDALQEGWLVEDLTEDQHIMNWLQQNTLIRVAAPNVREGVLEHVANTDYIDEIVKVVDGLIRDNVLEKR